VAEGKQRTAQGDQAAVDALAVKLRARSGANTNLSPSGPRETDLASRTATKREVATAGGAATTPTVRATAEEAAPAVTEVGGSALEEQAKKACAELAANTPIGPRAGKAAAAAGPPAVSHIGNVELCGSDASRRSEICRARSPRLYCYETETIRNGDRSRRSCRSHSSNAREWGGERRPSEAHKTSQLGLYEPGRCLIVVYRALPAAPFVVHCISCSSIGFEFEKGIGLKSGSSPRSHAPPVTRTHNFTFNPAAVSDGPLL